MFLLKTLLVLVWITHGDGQALPVGDIESEVSFLHGVASGDPLSDAIILWTRITPVSLPASTASVPVTWAIWSASDMQGPPFTSGSAWANQSRDFTVKVDVAGHGLTSGKLYAYHFESGRAVSPLGWFRLPASGGETMDSLKYAIFSCANWRYGYFTAYAAAAAASEKLDFWLHVGDFIYEMGSTSYPPPSEATREALEPTHEVVSLDDYRRRYALYRTDHSLQMLSAKAPSISIWDDHEVANNAFTAGAQNHQPEDEGAYSSRMQAAMQAYHEWMPTREDPKMMEPPYMKWRRFDFGDLATLLVLETRFLERGKGTSLNGYLVSHEIGRMLGRHNYPRPKSWPGSSIEKELKAFAKRADAQRHDAQLRILGGDQIEWIGEQLRESVQQGTEWQLVAQPLVLQRLMSADFKSAVDKAKADDASQASQWEALLANLSKGETKQDHLARVAMAAGTYKINLQFDGWMGHVHERERFLDAIGSAGAAANPVVYGGDSHNAWVGVLRDNATDTAIAVEFDGMSVSSPGFEGDEPWWPVDLQAAAFQAANPDLAWTDTHSRGFMFVELSHEEHMVTLFGVNISAPNLSSAECLANFRVMPGRRGELLRGSCPKEAMCTKPGPIVHRVDIIREFGHNSSTVGH